MNLDQAIKHAEEIARQECHSTCGKDHAKLVKWLKELKVFKNESGMVMSTVSFNIDHFKIGQAASVKYKDQKPWDGIILSVSKDIITFVCVKYQSGEFKSSGYESTQEHVRISEFHDYEVILK